ncbi:MAG: ABC transporter substrate-binding protein [Ferruginibacter sp.]
MKIGMLFPLSDVYPSIGFDFMHGLNSFLKEKQSNTPITIIKESVGFGGDEKDNYLKAQKLLISDDVDILIAFLDEKIISILYPLVQATGKLLIIVNPGANYPVNWVAQPTVIRLNLQHAFLCSLTGALAATNGNGQAALATSYYDCGYLHSAAMVNNFLEAGGEIKYNYVNNQAYNESFEINNLTNFLSSDPGCSNLLCVFDKLPASLFYKLLDSYETKERLHLFASPMMLQQALENSNTAYGYSIEGYLSWYEGLENEANKYFSGKCSGKPTMFSLLGWETGMIVDEAIQLCGDNGMDGERIIEHLKNITLDSPRGNMKLDGETQFYTAPVTKFRLQAGAVNPELISDINIENEWKQFSSKPTEGTVTGWTNTYLCY